MHHQVHQLHHHVIQLVRAFIDGATPLPNHQDTDGEQDGEKDDLQHIAFRIGRHRIGRHQIDDHLRQRRRLRCGELHRPPLQLETLTRSGHHRNRNRQRNRQRRGQQKQQKCPYPHPSQRRDIPNATHPANQ